MRNQRKKQGQGRVFVDAVTLSGGLIFEVSLKGGENVNKERSVLECLRTFE